MFVHHRRGYGHQEELSMESGIDPGQDYYTQDYYNYEHGYDLPQYGSRRKLISPTGMYDEYGEVIMEDDGSYYYSPQDSEGEYGRKKRIRLVVDREYETSSTGEESAPETQRGRPPGAPPTHGTTSSTSVNGSVYLAQNGSVVRTRRSVLANSFKPGGSSGIGLGIGSPSRLAKHFRKLDRLAVTHEERLPLNSPNLSDSAPEHDGTSSNPGAVATTPDVVAAAIVERNDLSGGGSLGRAGGSGGGDDGSAGGGGGPSLASSASATESSGSKVNLTLTQAPDRTSESGEQESAVDNEEPSRAQLVTESHSDRTQSDEEELWMGPWNNLHIPMTKL
ncbi:hypothetical protein AALO_G00279390 [Alosa alosa]|uniref:Uncharacterized protein n=1 Tax=Alosa alosa TaxID=278164 RepID=A0AAV6FM27_9TELE|nr:hypothetical protein AALO_G00279390 [Alosa alosa]